MHQRRQGAQSALVRELAHELPDRGQVGLQRSCHKHGIRPFLPDVILVAPIAAVAAAAGEGLVDAANAAELLLLNVGAHFASQIDQATINVAEDSLPDDLDGRIHDVAGGRCALEHLRGVR
eukprot:9484828-Pyramimonas_sp.AAC.1